MTYLDYNATAPIRPAVLAAVAALGDAPLNPSSIHAAGRQAKRLLEDARAEIASALSAFANEVLFVSSATEANNMVLRGFAPTHRLLVSAIEHASVGKTASLLGGAVIPVGADGVVDTPALDSMLAALGGQPALVSVMLANNETGIVQPLAEVARIAHAHGALVHTDAVQALGKIPLDWGLLGVDLLTLSAHKSGGPVGSAALLVRNDLPIKPLLTGGKQELGRRAGTDNVRAAVALAALVREVAPCREAEEWQQWRDWLAAELQSAAPQAWVAGINYEPPPTNHEPRITHHASLPQTLCIALPGVKSETQLMTLDLAGFAISAGSACASGRVTASETLLAMGLPTAIAESAIRISWGWASARSDLEAFAAAWKAMAARLGNTTKGSERHNNS